MKTPVKKETSKAQSGGPSAGSTRTSDTGRWNARHRSTALLTVPHTMNRGGANSREEEAC